MLRAMPATPTQFIARRYELIEIAGEGGMATVWRAIMRGAAGFMRRVAVKKIKPQYQAIQNYINMFVEEARVGSDLDHPHIVQVHDFVIDERSAYYLVMEWVEGLDLGSFVRSFFRGGLATPWQLLAIVAIDALRGLAAAHERHLPDGRAVPVIHRDVSPQNILISVNGIAKLTDFGLARARDRVFSLTAPGTVKGKLNYLPPEVTYGQPATPRSDIFSLGNVIWESLVGRRLFRGDSDLDTFNKIRQCEVPDLRELRPDLPEPLVQVIHKSLALQPDERFRSARDMARAMAAVLEGTGWRDDLRIELGGAVIQARSEAGITPDWQEQARLVEPRWRSHVDAPRPTPATAQRRLLDDQRLDVEFGDPQPLFESDDSLEIEFTDSAVVAHDSDD
jgi:serine/threonine-protein kinase